MDHALGARDVTDDVAEAVTDIEQALLSSQADAIMATDRDGVIRFWNPGAVRIFGFTREEAVGASLDLIIPERLRKRHWDGWDHVMETGETRYGAGDVLAVPALTKDGRQISVEFTITLIYDADRRISGMLSILRDVSARFEELRQLRRKLREAGRPQQADAPTPAA
jgi:PAS domain S-box-containing protein